MNRLIIITLLLLWALGATAQGNSRSGKKKNSIARDTTPIFHFFSINPNQYFTHMDTLLQDYFLQYDPVRKQRLPYGHLGLPGTAAYSLVNLIPFQKGIDIGLHQYNLYRLSPENIKYYKVEQAYTRAGFSQGLTQQETTFDAEFAREFKGNLTLSFKYLRMNNTGFYENHQTENSAFGLNAWFHSKNNRYRALGSIIINKNDQQENGGVAQLPQNESLSRDTVDNPVLATLFLSSSANAQNRYAERIYNFKQYYQLNKEKFDTLNKGSRAYTLVHEATFTNATYKYTDEAPDSDFYGNYFTDDRGSRHYLAHQKLENTFSISTFKTDKRNQLPTENGLLELGLMHRYNQIVQEPDTTTINELFAVGKWEANFTKHLTFDLAGHLGLLGSAGDYRVDGKLSIDLGKGGKLNALVTQQLARPTFVQNSFIVSQQRVFQNDYKKTLSTKIGGTYTLPLIGFSGEVSYQLLNNQIYFDTVGIPQQADVAISIGRITAQQSIQWHSFHLDNQVTLQQVSSDFIRIPPVYSKHSLYLKGRIFKKVMLATIGLDLRLNAPYKPYAYFPLNGQFVLQNEQSVNWQPLVDAFLGFKVKKLRVGTRYENILPLLNRYDYYKYVANYPAAHGYIRFLVKWQFID